MRVLDVADESASRYLDHREKSCFQNWVPIWFSWNGGSDSGERSCVRSQNTHCYFNELFSSALVWTFFVW